MIRVRNYKEQGISYQHGFTFAQAISFEQTDKLMANNTSQHILNSAANLLGFCLFVITSLHIANQTETHLIDEFTSVIAILLSASCIFSFVSIRTKSAERERRLETIADYLFVTSLIGILIIILLVTLDFIK